MRSRLRLFGLVGIGATAVDVGVLVALAHLGLVLADAIALALAAMLAYLSNRYVTFRGLPSARWVSQPTLFAATAVVAGAIDLGVLTGLDRLGLPLIPVKATAVSAAAIVRWTAYRWILFGEVRRALAERVERPLPPGDLRVSIVVPAFNEEALIGPSVDAIRSELVRHLGAGDGAGSADEAFEVIVVDDGSSDDTASQAARAGARVVRLDANAGKGAAVRAGAMAARGRAIVFTDADLAYPPRLVVEVLANLELGWDLVVGSRRHADTNTLVKARRARELGGRVINLLTRAVLLGNFRDTQCGLKGYRSDIGKATFARTRIDGFAFDVELFLMAEQDQISVLEVPVSVVHRPGSSVNLVGDTAGLLADLFRIRRWAGEGVYRPTGEQLRVLEPGEPDDSDDPIPRTNQDSLRA